MGTDFRMATMLRELSDCIRTMPNVNGDHMHILTIENRFQTHIGVDQCRAKGRKLQAMRWTMIQLKIKLFCFSFFLWFDL